MLGVKLRGKIGDVGLQLFDLRLGLVQLRRVDGIIDPGEDGACFDNLIIVDVELADRAGNLWADRDRMRVDKGVVRGLELARMHPPENAGGDNDENDEKGDCHKPRSIAQILTPGGGLHLRRRRVRPLAFSRSILRRSRLPICSGKRRACGLLFFQRGSQIVHEAISLMARPMTLGNRLNAPISATLRYLPLTLARTYRTGVQY
jgi:hypothetical protein